MKATILVALWAIYNFMQPITEPQFAGGKVALSKFIVSNIVYPRYSRQRCLQGTVMVSFKLSLDGVVNQATVSSGPGTDLDEEALRVVRLSSHKWKIPTNYNTDNTLTIPVIFKLDDRSCADIPALQKQQAILYYQEQKELTSVITSYYTGKKGVQTPREKERIIALKKQLGYNDQYFDDIIDQALNKYKQGDTTGCCDDLRFVKSLGSDKADKYLVQYCR